MKLLLLCALASLSTAGAQIQVTVASNENQVSDRFLTSEISSITPDIKTTFNGPSESFGLFSNGAFGRQFVPGLLPVDSPIDNDMRQGIVISTGKVTDAMDLGMREGTDFGRPGIADDDISLDFQFGVAQETTVSFKYVFASREIPLYAGEINDNFAMYTHTSTESPSERKNIAKLPILDDQRTDVIDDVTVNNLTPTCERSLQWRPEVLLNFDTGMSATQNDCTTGRTNPNSFMGRRHFGYTGYTSVLEAVATFKPGVTNFLNISVIDVNDGYFDTAVFLAANTLRVVASYEYDVGQWGQCSTICDAGVQTRPVFCKTSANQAVDMSLCSEQAPSATKPCNLKPCDSYNWQFGQWSACSATCGTGSRARQLSCVSSSGAGANSAQCPRETPAGATTESCSGSAGPCINGQWKYTEWTACSHTCGTGVQYRELQCVSDTTVLDNSACTDFMPREPVQRNCNPQPCGEYTWRLLPWGGCSVSCGGGQRTRVLDCVDKSGSSSPVNMCKPEERPDTDATPLVESCMEQPCYKYAWQLGDYGFCSTSCGAGVQSRKLMCMRTLGDDSIAGAGVQVSDLEPGCIEAEKPSTNMTQPCDNGPCPSYEYVMSEWSSCSSSCGTGFRIREQSCVEKTIGRRKQAEPKPVSPERCSRLVNPACPQGTGLQDGVRRDCQLLEEKCEAAPCETYKYGTSEWGTCSLTCGGGIKIRTLTCMRESDGEEVDTKLCTLLPNPLRAPVAPVVYTPVAPIVTPIVTPITPIVTPITPIVNPIPVPVVLPAAPVVMPVQSGCVDKSEFCPIWANPASRQNSCETATQYMRENCPVSCNFCAVNNVVTPIGRRLLQDGNRTVSVTAADERPIVEAIAAPMPMLTPAIAPATIVTTAATNNCIDKHTDCTIWSQVGQCTQPGLQTYMSENCCASCGFVGVRIAPVAVPIPAMGVRTDSWVNPREPVAAPTDPPVAPGDLSLEASCNSNPCEMYTFQCEAWSGCDVTCGAGSQKRQCNCVDADGNKVEDDLCDTNLLGEKPNTVKTCNTFVECSPYTYQTTNWCTRAVDPCLDKVVTFTRDVTCVSVQEQTVVRDELCANEKPSTELKCDNIDTYEAILTEQGCGAGVTRPPRATLEPTAAPTVYTALGKVTIDGDYDSLTTGASKALIIDLARKLGAGGCGEPYEDATRPGWWVIECAGGKTMRARLSAGSIVIEYEATGFTPEEIAAFEEAMEQPDAAIGGDKVSAFTAGTQAPTASPTEIPTTAAPETPAPTAPPVVPATLAPRPPPPPTPVVDPVTPPVSPPGPGTQPSTTPPIGGTPPSPPGPSPAGSPAGVTVPSFIVTIVLGAVAAALSA